MIHGLIPLLVRLMWERARTTLHVICDVYSSRHGRALGCRRLPERRRASRRRASAPRRVPSAKPLRLCTRTVRGHKERGPMYLNRTHCRSLRLSRAAFSNAVVSSPPQQRHSAPAAAIIGSFDVCCLGHTRGPASCRTCASGCARRHDAAGGKSRGSPTCAIGRSRFFLPFHPPTSPHLPPPPLLVVCGLTSAIAGRAKCDACLRRFNSGTLPTHAAPQKMTRATMVGATRATGSTSGLASLRQLLSLTARSLCSSLSWGRLCTAPRLLPHPKTGKQQK